MIKAGINSFKWTYSNMSTPSTTPGTSVTPGASNVEGTFTQVASSANVANDVYGVELWISGGNTTATAKNHLLDIGVDQAGGSSYTAAISNIVCGQSSAALNGGICFYFPLFIKSGSSVAIRIQGDNATAGTVRVGIKLFGRPSRPELVRIGVYTETIGTITGSTGVSVTPGNSAAEGSWASVGTTTKELWFFQLGVQCNNATTTSLAYTFDLAYGDVSNKHMIIEDLNILLPGTAEQTTILGIFPLMGYCEVPAGSTLYVRGSCSGTTVTGWNVLVNGIGG